jgi:hypothetical protein
LTCWEPFKKVKTGDKVVFEININNFGNGRDTFAADIQNKKELSDEGFGLDLNVYTLEVDEKENRTIQLSVDVPAKRGSIGRHTIDVVVVSEMSAEMEDTGTILHFPINIKVEAGSVLQNNYFLGSLVAFIIVVVILLTIFIKSKDKGFNFSKSFKKISRAPKTTDEI